MKKRRLFWKLYPGLILVIAASLLLSALYATREIRSLYLNEIKATLLARAQLIDEQIHNDHVTDQKALDDMCKRLGRISGTRITLISRDGTVLGDSQHNPAFMENHGSRPEISPALNGEIGTQARFSNTLQIEMLYVAVPFSDSKSDIGVIRTALPMTAIHDVLSALYWKLTLGGLIIVVLAGVIGWILIRRETRSLEALRLGADQFARGELGNRLPLADSEEISGLAEAMNQMAAQLDRRIGTIVTQWNEQEAILSSMSEGVIALDLNEHIVSLNLAAARLLGFDAIDHAKGMVIHQALRSSVLMELLSGGDKETSSAEINIGTAGKTERDILINVSQLIDVNGKQIGSVLVLNDMTKINKLEQVRKDFVANVSHELRTPVTAIRGAVETMIDSGMINDPDADRFARMIFDHADRLNRIIEDLLILARLESDEEAQPRLKTEKADLRKIIEAVVGTCAPQAKEKAIEVKVSAPPDFIVNVNPFQIEQAIRNLVENAIKYCDSGSSVTVSAGSAESEVMIEVKDTGWGIEQKHLPRLFERFYRADPARSRDSGGTGLGLAIVRHIALLHGGRVTVESAPGVGSSFRIHLPAIT